MPNAGRIPDTRTPASGPRDTEGLDFVSLGNAGPDTFGVPGPIVSSGLPGLLFVASLLLVRLRRCSVTWPSPSAPALQAGGAKLKPRRNREEADGVLTERGFGFLCFTHHQIKSWCRDSGKRNQTADRSLTRKV
jgi:hypothetical protein